MNKTSVVTTLPCGCEARVWCFGREIIKPNPACSLHGLFRQPRRWSWPQAPKAERSGARSPEKKWSA